MGGLLEVNYGDLACTDVIGFEEVEGGNPPGTNYDAVVSILNVRFAERFAGQILGTSRYADSLSGSPGAPLSLQAGEANRNLVVLVYNGTFEQVLSGLGNVGFPHDDAIGEGAVAVRFNCPQSEVGFYVVGGDGGYAYLDFFASDGAWIGGSVLFDISGWPYAFRCMDGSAYIAGFSIWNTDPAGIGLDLLRYDAGAPSSVESVRWGRIKGLFR
jgi:hypothetical protein